MLNPEVRAHLDSPAVAHLATVLPDGSPHNVPIWVGTHGEQVVFLTGPQSQKARNLRRDPRVALSLTAVGNPFLPVTVRGRVVRWVDGDEAWEIIDRIAMKYTGGPYPRGQDRVVAVVEVERQKAGL
jgi:PPOX class probable F420-dependent enzyme